MAPLSWPSTHAYFCVLTGQEVQQSYMPGHLGTVLANARGFLSSLKEVLNSRSGTPPRN